MVAGNPFPRIEKVFNRHFQEDSSLEKPEFLEIQENIDV
jgi:hypothetical protein